MTIQEYRVTDYQVGRQTDRLSGRQVYRLASYPGPLFSRGSGKAKGLHAHALN